MAVLAEEIEERAQARERSHLSLHSRRERTIKGDHLRLEVWKTNDFDFDSEVRLVRNHQIIFISALGGLPTADFLWWPYETPAFAVREHSLNGHGENTYIFSLYQGKPDLVLTLEGEVGGPIFRDFDQDGRVEMAFDDQDWYTYYGERPGWVGAFRVDARGQVKYWKSMINRGETLPRIPSLDFVSERRGSTAQSPRTLASQVAGIPVFLSSYQGAAPGDPIPFVKSSWPASTPDRVWPGKFKPTR